MAESGVSLKTVRFTEKEEIFNDVTPTDADSGEVFTASCEAFTPRLEPVQYKAPNHRTSEAIAPPSSIVRPNYEDLLRRVSVVIHQHIRKCEAKLESISPEMSEKGAFHASKISVFSEENFISPQYIYHFVRMPITRTGFCYSIRKLQRECRVPNPNEVYTFLRTLFVKAQLSPECSIVCLIYVEKLMEHAKVPLVAVTWRPCLLCGLLLASKVWQDLSSWNSEISQIYPQFSLKSINRLERTFCVAIDWDLFISSSVYAKYYFALRSLSEKKDFRRDYNVMVVKAPGSQHVAERTIAVKETALNTTLSKSL
eukprot:gene7807-15973_t